MKKILPLLLAVCLVACKKESTTPPSLPAYPDNWGMTGNVNNTSFNASSFGASLIYDTTKGKFELNIDGWQSNTNETIYLRYSDFSFQPKTYRVDSSLNYPGSVTFGYYQKDNQESQFGEGVMEITSTDDTLIKGRFYFRTKNNTGVNGVFTVKPQFVYQ
jgi:hypothetical protein